MKIRSTLFIVILLLFSYRGYSQCTLNVTLSKSAPTICSGNSITLTATTSGGKPPFTYVWSTGETSATITVNKGGTYTVSVSDNTNGCQPVKQNIAVTTSTTPDAPTSKAVTVCPNSAATLVATAPGGTYQWYDSAGKYLFTGDTYTTQPISNATTFFVETTMGGCTSARTPVSVFLPGKPNVNGATVCAGNVATLFASGGDTYTWYDAATGGNIVGTGTSFTTPVLKVTTTYYVIVSNNGCASSPTAVTANVSAPPQPPVVTDQVICSGATANLHADAPAGLFNWFSTPTGGVPLISSPDYTTPSLTANTTYYVQTSINDCLSKRVPVNVIVNSPPQAPQAQTQTICYQSSAVLTASTNPAGTYKWYDAPAGGNLLFTGVTYTTPVLTNSTAYFVQITDGNCVSDRTQISVVVKPQLSAPSASGSIVCQNGIATLTATADAGNYQWFDAATGGKLLSNAATFTTPALTATTTYYIQRTYQGCVSPRSAVTVTVLPVINAPTAANTSVCPGNPAVLTANSPTGNYAWYDSANGGTLLSNGQVFVTPPLTTATTYYVETSNSSGCLSARTAVVVTINTIPAPPTANGTSTCFGTTATLTAAAAAGGNIQWYGQLTGGNMLATGTSYTTPALTATTTYYVQTTNASCTSARTPVIVTVNPVIDPQFEYASGTYCTSNINQIPVIFNKAGGTFTVSPAGLVFVSNTTGEINIGASTPGIYQVSFTGKDACPHTSTTKILVTTSSSKADFVYNQPFCQDGGNPLPAFLNGGSAGTFTASPAGLQFVDASTGQINLGQSAPGTYTITNIINANGICTVSKSVVTVTIYQKVTVSAGSSQNVGVGATVQLAGSINGALTTGKWSGGTGTFSNATQLNSSYSPGPGETVANLTLTSDDPAGTCGPKSGTVTIYFNLPPPAPTAPGVATCLGTSTSLSATAPGGNYQWYSAATGGSIVASGPAFTTPILTATTTYYVQTTINGIASARTPVEVTVTPELAAPVVATSPICKGSVTTLTATGSAGTYEWYDAAVGGNLLKTGNTYVTPALNVTSDYYVQARVNNCVSTRTKVDLPVTPEPNVTSAPNGVVCSGNAQGYNITADVAGATFLWSRAQVTGISNPAASAQTSATINETLINNTQNAVIVTYNINALSGACSGPDFLYTVIVYPQPVVTSPPKATICNYNTDNYQITFNIPGTNFSWSRTAVAGVSNAAVTGQNSSIIREVLFNTSSAPIDVPYTINYKTSSCDGVPFTLLMTVNPTAIVKSASTGTICSNTPQNYAMSSNISSSTYTWSRDFANNVTNPAVYNQTSSTITESLENTGSYPVNVIYTIIPQAYGCDGIPFKYTVTVNPELKTPVANSNSPVCINSTIKLLTPTVPNVTYLWTGPNGFTSTLQNPVISNVTAANAGVYTLVTIGRGCQSPPATVTVNINSPAIAKAGPDQTTCSTTTVIQLAGTITGGTSTGIWTSNGTGTFVKNDLLTTQYLPSAADKAAGSVILTLASTSKDDCTVSMDDMTVKFAPLPGVDAGPNQELCSQEPFVQLAGKIHVQSTVKWTTSGGGTFRPSDSQVDATYIPTAADIQKGLVKLTLTLQNSGACFSPSDSMTVKFDGPPTVYAGGTRYVLKGNNMTLNPTVSTDSLTYLWAPNADINNVNAKNPVITGNIDRFYTLTVTDTRGCQTTDTTYIKVSPLIKINNTFTPNGDGINDQWVITGLDAYTNATVDIFNRYGQKLFHSVGYPKAWDGTYNGAPLASGVYYYIVDTRVYKQVLTGYVTIIR